MPHSPEFTGELARLLNLDYDTAYELAELLDARVSELTDERVKEALDREFNRGDYRRD